MSSPNLLVELAARPLICDGAMGTQLLARGMTSGECGMLWNVEKADAVRAVHDAYRAAGCDLITTNSFGGSAFALEKHRVANRGPELNRAAAEVARAAAGETGWVLGDVGPFGDFLEPVGDMTIDELHAIFRAQIEALLDGGADAILVETMVDPAEAVVGVEAARAARSDVPIIVTYAFQKSAPGTFHTIMGTTVAEGIRKAVAAGAQIVGANCGTSLGLDDYADLAKQIVAAADATPVIIQPNAGAPQVRGTETFYEATPEQMAELAGRLINAGVRIVGGCCGTTPGHLAAMAKSVHGIIT
jgi:5-methyltetrahydrofolate--homocysteine methyltransferase